MSVLQNSAQKQIWKGFWPQNIAVDKLNPKKKNPVSLDVTLFMASRAL